MRRIFRVCSINFFNSVVGLSKWSEKAIHLACQLENEKKTQMNSNSHLNPQVKCSPKALSQGSTEKFQELRHDPALLEFASTESLMAFRASTSPGTVSATPNWAKCSNCKRKRARISVELPVAAMALPIFKFCNIFDRFSCKNPTCS